MTNTQILEKAAAAANIPEGVVFNTFIGWKMQGYSVNKGEKAAFSAKIWIPKKKNYKAETMTGEETEAQILEHFFSKNACYFLESQVSKIEN